LSGTEPGGAPDGARLTPGGFHSFEHRWALADAFAFHQAVGRVRIANRVHALTRQLQAELSRVRGIRLRTPAAAALSAGLVCFEVAGRSADDVVRLLAARRIVASTTPYATRYVRLGPGIVNSPAEIDATVRAIASL
jgi:selenocysteine lyase/cysteine desulfurase